MWSFLRKFFMPPPQPPPPPKPRSPSQLSPRPLLPALVVGGWIRHGH
uniref:Uncharacterized protein n=1 Tax=Arundo donax TaxID=35708 RepID=A0A0A9FRM7_ARUDO